MTDVLFVIGLIIFTTFAVSFVVHKIDDRKMRGDPSEFASGVARSMTRDPDSWDYWHDENWLVSTKANLEISLQAANFGLVNVNQIPNIGTKKITRFQRADERVFRIALHEWKNLTAIDRQHIAEKRKREALQALSAERA